MTLLCNSVYYVVYLVSTPWSGGGIQFMLFMEALCCDRHTCYKTTKRRVSAAVLDTVSEYTIDIDHEISPQFSKALATI